MSAPQRFQDKEYKNWVKCSLALVLMKEGLHDYVDTGVKKLHLHIKQNLTSTPGGPSVGKICGCCTWKDVRKEGYNPIRWNIKCKNSVCDKWLSQILAVHNEPNNHGINWKNADICRWPTDPYEIAKVYMPKGQDRTHNNLPQELDAPAVLSLLKYCTLFRTRIPNVQLLSDLIDFRNEVLHSGELKVLDSTKDICIGKMIQLLSDLNVNGSAQSELNRIKCEDIDVNFRENEIQALQNLVSGLGSKLAEVTGEMTSLQNVQIQQSEETTKHAEEVKKSLQEVKEIHDKMESFLNKNPDIDDREISRNMTDFKKDIHNLQEELSQVKVKVSSLENQLEKHKEETQLQFKGVGRQLAALKEKGGNNKQLIHQKDKTTLKEEYQSIESLTPSLISWKIRARVTMKGEIATKRKKNSAGRFNKIKYFQFKVIDDSGEIQGVAFNDAVDKFFRVLKMGKVFVISGASLTQADSKFNSTTHKYQIIINKDACIKPCQDAGDISPYGEFDFTTIDKLQDVRPGELVDIIAVVKECGECETVKTKKRKNLVKREIQLVDQSGMQVGLTLWRSDAEHFLGGRNPVLALKGVQVLGWAGRSLTMLPNSQKHVNPKIAEAEVLRLWFSNKGKQMKFTGFS